MENDHVHTNRTPPAVRLGTRASSLAPGRRCDRATFGQYGRSCRWQGGSATLRYSTSPSIASYAAVMPWACASISNYSDTGAAMLRRAGDKARRSWQPRSCRGRRLPRRSRSAAPVLSIYSPVAGRCCRCVLGTPSELTPAAGCARRRSAGASRGRSGAARWRRRASPSAPSSGSSRQRQGSASTAPRCARR